MNSKKKKKFLEYKEVGKSKILKTIRASLFLKMLPILAQFPISIPTENVRKPSDVFRGYKNGTWG